MSVCERETLEGGGEAGGGGGSMPLCHLLDFPFPPLMVAFTSQTRGRSVFVIVVVTANIAAPPGTI